MNKLKANKAGKENGISEYFKRTSAADSPMEEDNEVRRNVIHIKLYF